MLLTEHQYERITGKPFKELTNISPDEKKAIENFRKSVLKQYRHRNTKADSFNALLKQQALKIN